ncbi:MAG: hypothetical protein FJ405_07965, partial [Verrucomicrobia bacterium]|nr:hypothetical protein [Verrucomicrobiota bacterium]
MSGFAAIFAIVSAILILALPRRWAPLPFLIGICYMTLGQGIALGPFNFTVIRLLILAGAARLLIRGEFTSIGFNTMDRIAIAWAVWTLFSSYFHAEPREALIFRMGVTFNALGVYFLFRSFIKSQEDAVRVAVMAAIVLIPVAAEMLSEKATGRNAFALLGGVPPEVVERNGKLRAQGPFAHPILAGTVGAVCLPFIVGLWASHRKIAIAGITACV